METPVISIAPRRCPACKQVFTPPKDNMRYCKPCHVTWLRERQMLDTRWKR